MRGMEFDLDQVLNPAAVFNHPRDVLNDPDLSKQEKRAILSSWASDACAVESVPGLRQRQVRGLPSALTKLTMPCAASMMILRVRDPEANRCA